jgi:hypothetical protein
VAVPLLSQRTTWSYTPLTSTGTNIQVIRQLLFEAFVRSCAMAADTAAARACAVTRLTMSLTHAHSQVFNNGHTIQVQWTPGALQSSVRVPAPGNSSPACVLCACDNRCFCTPSSVRCSHNYLADDYQYVIFCLNVNTVYHPTVTACPPIAGNDITDYVNQGSLLNLRTVTAEPLQLHFHTDSEHVVEGVYHPLEMHIVHRVSQSQLPGCPASGCLFVTGVLIKLDPANQVSLIACRCLSLAGALRGLSLLFGRGLPTLPVAGTSHG